MCSVSGSLTLVRKNLQDILTRFTFLTTFLKAYFKLIYTKFFRHLQVDFWLVFSVQESCTVLKAFLKDAGFGLSLDLDARNTRVEISQTGQCVDFRFSRISFFISRASSRAAVVFSVPNPKLCLLGLWKMTVLPLREIFTRVFYAWNSVASNNAWVGNSRPCNFSAFFSRSLARLAATCHNRVFDLGILKYGSWVPQISISVCYAQNSWTMHVVEIFAPFIFLFPCAFSRVCDVPLSRVRSRDYGWWVLKDASFSPTLNFHKCVLRAKVY